MSDNTSETRLCDTSACVCVCVPLLDAEVLNSVLRDLMQRALAGKTRLSLDAIVTFDPKYDPLFIVSQYM